MFPPFSLAELTVFVAVVDEGSFSAAGRRLGRVQSAVSYAIGQLEGSLGRPLFDRSGHTPVLTDEGRRLAEEARLVLAQARELAETAARLREGVEPELRLVVDALYPSVRLAEVCEAFAAAFPSTALRLESALLHEAVEVVRRGGADLGVCNLAGGGAGDLRTAHLGEVQLVPVCAADHPLASAPAPHREGLLRGTTQIVHTERQREQTRDQGVLAARTWRVTDLGLKAELIVRGVGWGSLPLPVAEPLIAAGRLVRLQPEPWPPGGHRIVLHLVTRPERPIGRAGQWFRERLAL